MLLEEWQLAPEVAIRPEPFGALAYANLATHVGLAPAGEEIVDADSGRPSAGPKIWIESAKNRRIGRPELVGDVFSESGENLSLVQLQCGYATAHIDAPKAYHAAEATARKARRGMWASSPVKDQDDYQPDVDRQNSQR